MKLNTIEDLRNWMTINQTTSKEEIAERFKEMADFLLKECIIKTPENEYTFEDIEFYFYSDTHPDIITHPRNTEALHWYINTFGGLDLTFKSSIKMEPQEISGNKTRRKPLLSKDSYFGGILIRQIRRSKDNILFESPLLCSEELISHFDAVTGTAHVPQLRIKHRDNIEITQSLRLNLIPANKTAQEKIDSIKSMNFHKASPEEYFCTESFVEHCNKEYRFTTNGKNVQTKIRTLKDNPYR